MHFCLRSVVTLEMGERTEKSEERVMLGGRLYIDFPFVKFKFTLRAARGTDGGAEALPAARKKKDGGEGGSDSALRASPDAHSWDSPARSGGDVGVAITCFHDYHCQRANEASLGHTSGFATDERKPEGTASREGHWHSFCFPPFSADRLGHQSSL